MRPRATDTARPADGRIVAACCIAIAAFVALVSLTHDNSPLSTAYPNIDSGVFQYIGSHVLQGQMPYLDFFDHKGPTLYLLNTLGALIAPGGLGLYVVETVFLIAAALVSYFTCRRFATDAAALAAVILVYATLGRSLFGGNYVEEYALLFASVTLFCLSSYFVKGRLASWEAFAIGFCAGCVLFLRPNLLGAWVVFCAAIIIFMAREGKAGDIVRVALFAGLGFLCLVAPVLLWLALGGALPDFIDQYLRFNMEYSATYSWAARIETFWWMLGGQPTLIAALAAGVFAAIQTRRVGRKGLSLPSHPESGSRFWVCLLIATLLTVAFASMSGREYEYYLMAWVPYAACPIAYALGEVFSYVRQNFDLHRGRSIALAAATVAVAGLCLIPNIATGYGYAQRYHVAQDAEDADGRGGVVQTVLALTSPDDKLVVCGAECWVYTETERSAATRYIFQPDDTRLEIRQQYLFEDIQANKPKLVVIPNNYNAFDALRGMPGYSLVFQNGGFMVYMLDAS